MKRRTFIQNLPVLGALVRMGIGEPQAQAGSAVAAKALPTLERPAEVSTAQPCAPMTLDQLPLLPHGVSVHQFSSHNKKGMNGDADWFLYKDAQGDPVIFDAMGPGCLRSIWQTLVVEGQILKFYFDGETQPRYVIPTLDLYRGRHPLFPAPLTSFEAVGRYKGDHSAGNCFVPVPFAQSLRISIQGGIGVYHFLYERYPYGTPVATFTGKEDRYYLLRAFEHKGEELQPVADEGVIRTSTPGVDPMGRLDLLNVQSAGTITRVVVEGDASDEFLHQVEIDMQWDESPRPDVLAPLGMFFGAGVRVENVRSLPTKVEMLPNRRVRLSSYFRMPFWRKGRVSLVNRQPKPTGPITAAVHLAPARYHEGEAAYFCALYRDGRTEMGRDWLFCDASGTGWFVGVVQTMYGDHYCEGNEHFVVDGAGMPQVNGTGSEDYYLACFWPNRNFNLPFAGCVGDIFLQPGPACYYRFHLDAPIPFYQSLDARIQHGGNSDIVSQYRSLGFYYVRKRPAMHLTDFVDIAGEASERTHAYRAPHSTLTGELDAAYEGNNVGILVRDRGRTHNGGEIRFVAATLPDNGGVRLRRRIDQNSPRQAADVYVDGKPAGTWYHPDQNPYLRWFDSEFDLPANLTRGKRALKISLLVRKGQGYGPFTDFRYEVLSFDER